MGLIAFFAPWVKETLTALINDRKQIQQIVIQNTIANQELRTAIDANTRILQGLADQKPKRTRTPKAL
ncbi:MAG TPA: hypothetical protein PKA27_02265 [Fimbriimonadaceae bacterium]|nr:hypothetical protein [Fimbriimonadaceae bacterium]